MLLGGKNINIKKIKQSTDDVKIKIKLKLGRPNKKNINIIIYL